MNCGLGGDTHVNVTVGFDLQATIYVDRGVHDSPSGVKTWDKNTYFIGVYDADGNALAERFAAATDAHTLVLLLPGLIPTMQAMWPTHFSGKID